MEHDGHRERMRQRFMEEGLNGFAPHEVLEVLLMYAIPRVNTNPIAHRLLDHFGSFHRVLEAHPRELMQVKGVGAQAATLLSMLLPVFRLYQMDQMKPKPLLETYQQMADYCKTLFLGAAEEKLYLLCLDGQLKLLAAELIATGTPAAVQMAPRQMVQALIRHHATGAVITHNHPSGSLFPSQEDVDITAQVQMLFSGMGIRLYDHILIADGQDFSFHRSGYLDEPKPLLFPLEEEVDIAAEKAQHKMPARKRKQT